MFDFANIFNGTLVLAMVAGLLSLGVTHYRVCQLSKDQDKISEDLRSHTSKIEVHRDPVRDELRWNAFELGFSKFEHSVYKRIDNLENKLDRFHIENSK